MSPVRLRWAWLAVALICGTAAVGPCSRAEAQAPANEADRYGGVSSIEIGAPATPAAAPTAMPPNPLRAGSSASNSMLPAADPFAASAAGAGAAVPTLHFDGRVQAAAAETPVTADEPAAAFDPAEGVIATSDGDSPTSASPGTRAPLAAAASMDSGTPSLEFTLPPAATPADVASAPAEASTAAEPAFAYPPAEPYGAAPAEASVDALPVMPPESTYAGADFGAPADADRRLAPPAPERGPRDAERSRGANRSSYLPAAFARFDGLSTAGAGLAIVVGLFLVCTWMVRRTGPKPAGVLPNEAFAVLGRAPLNTGSFAQLLRVGNKLVLVAVTSDGAQPLTEVTDPDEVDRLTGLCQGSRPGGHSAEFQQVLAQLSREPARGFLGREGSAARRRTA